MLVMNYVRVDDTGDVQTTASADVISRAPDTAFTLQQWPEIVDVLHVPWNKIVRTDLVDRSDIRFPAGLYEDVVFTYACLRHARAIEVERQVCYAYRSGRPGALTGTTGAQHATFPNAWGKVLGTYHDQPLPVRQAIFRRMLWHGWAVLANPVRLQGELRRQFFEQLVRLYEHEHLAGSHDAVLSSRSWTAARLRVLGRRGKARIVQYGRSRRHRPTLIGQQPR
jgi:CDP-glycerol glycerophosphotransferase